MSNVIPFKQRPRREYQDSDLVCLFFIMQGLTKMYGKDDAFKAKFIREHCPRISRAMLEAFKDKVVLSCQEHAKKEITPGPVYEWMTR